METARQRRNTVIFVALLMLGGLIHFLYRFETYYVWDILATCTLHAIYAGLIVYWIQSVGSRLVRSPSRSCTLTAGGMMLLFLLIRTLKYRLAVNPWLMRLLWYVYYVPMLMMPTLFLMTCVRFYSGRDSKPREKWLLMPALLLTLALLTNDLHHWAFVPRVEPALLQGVNGTYSYGILYWLIYGWIGLCIALGLLFLLWKARKLRQWRRALWPMLFLIAIPVVTAVDNALFAHGLHKIYELPETYIFCMLGVFEACIHSRLMPCNENYPAFFASLDMPAVITDVALSPLFQSSAALMATADQLRAALTSPQAINDDVRLYGRRVNGGCAFWTVDEGTLHRLNERLQEANETISLQNQLTQYEHQQQEEKARIDARNAVYARAARELYPVQRRISAMLDDMQPDAPEFRVKLARVCALNAFVKRKTNFILTYGQRDDVDIEELYLALREVAGFLNDCGLAASVERQGPAVMAYDDVIALYDGFLMIVEALLNRATRMMVFLRKNSLSMTVNGGLAQDWPQLPCSLGVQQSDGLTYLTLTAKGGGA